MKVHLRQNWFGPDGKRYRKGVVEMDDGLEKFLPKSAEVQPEPAPEPKKTKKTASDENPPAEKKPALDL